MSSLWIQRRAVTVSLARSMEPDHEQAKAQTEQDEQTEGMQVEVAEPLAEKTEGCEKIDEAPAETQGHQNDIEHSEVPKCSVGSEAVVDKAKAGLSADGSAVADIQRSQTVEEPATAEAQADVSMIEEDSHVDDSTVESTPQKVEPRAKPASQKDANETQNEPPAPDFTTGVKVEVEYEGDWWDAHVVEEGDDDQVRVHYVGGTDEEDEWISTKEGRIRPAARAEVVWAKVQNTSSAPAVLLQGSLKNPYCKKLQIYHFVDHLVYFVRREHLTPFTLETIPKRNSDKRLAAAIEVARDVFTTGNMPEDLAPHDPSLEEGPPGMTGYPPISRGSKGIKKPQILTAQDRRRAAMRKLGLLPPLGLDGGEFA